MVDEESVFKDFVMQYATDLRDFGRLLFMPFKAGGKALKYIFSQHPYEEDALKQEAMKQEKELEIKVNSALKNVVVFSGNKAEFEEFVGHKTEFINLNRACKNLGYVPNYDRNLSNPFEQFCAFETQKKLVDEGIVALINAVYITRDSLFFHQAWYEGLPVKKL